MARNETKSAPTGPALFDQPLPANHDAEQGVLGSVIIAPEVLDEIVAIVRPEDFLDERHGMIYRAMRDRLDLNKRIDVTLLVDELQRRKQFDAVGGAAYLAKLARAVPHAAHAAYYANIVREKATYRALIQIGTTIIRDAYDESDDAKQQANNAEQAIFEVVNAHTAKETTTIATALQEEMDLIDARCSGKVARGVRTGFSEFDALTGGMQAGQLLILAARPSMGKSALALNIALNVAMEEEQPVLFVSLEMPQVDLMDRVIASVGGISLHRIRNGSLSPDDRASVRATMGNLHSASFYLNDQAGLTLTEISAEARRCRRKAKRPLGLIVIDYLQLIEPDNQKDPREQQVAKISRRLKLLAKQLECPVLCLAQLNRQTETAKDNKPRLSHLRESGAIEQDADVVMFVHREEYYAETEDNRGKAQILIAKQRSGPIGEANLVWRKEFTRFENPRPEYADAFDDFNAPKGEPAVAGSWQGHIGYDDDRSEF
jgi:replicative DNA helicase